MPYITVVVTPFQHAVLGTEGDQDNGYRDVVCVTVLALTPALILAFTPADATARPSRLSTKSNNRAYGGFGYRFIVPCAYSPSSAFSANAPLTPLVDGFVDGFVDRFVEEFRDADSEADGDREVVGGEGGEGSGLHASAEEE